MASRSFSLLSRRALTDVRAKRNADWQGRLPLHRNRQPKSLNHCRLILPHCSGQIAGGGLVSRITEHRIGWPLLDYFTGSVADLEHGGVIRNSSSLSEVMCHNQNGISPTKRLN